MIQTDTYYGSAEYNAVTQYDKYGKVLQKETATYSYESNDGSAASYRLNKIEDTATGVTTQYEYDEDNRVKSVIEKVNGAERFSVTQNSAAETKFTYGEKKANANQETSSIKTEYDTTALISPRVTNVKYFAGESEEAIESWIYDSYDSFGRVTQKRNKNGEWWDGKYVYTYLSNGTKTLNRVSECNYNGSYMFNNNFVVINRKYEYDGQGNISKETETSSCMSPNSDGSLNYSATHTYEYDSQNRLLSVKDEITEDEDTTTNNYSYEYDENGRLDSINRQGFPGSLTYDDRGRLIRISFNGSGGAFYSYDYAYDNYGNRTEKRYRNGGDILAKYTWTRGRLLEKIENGIDDVIGRYTYNADGIRYSKTADGVTTKFYYNGITLMGEDRSDNKKLRYCYDQEGICGFRYYNGSEWKAYTYVKNLQGDIILIKDDMGAPKVKYEYDPWGNVTPVALNLDGGEANPDEEELAKINPFRYRGYYYDEESKLYYLITRYYDPWVGQFISPDSFEYLDPGTIGGINLYAYCNYNPIMYIDPTGHSVMGLLIGLSLAAVALFTPVGGVVVQTVASTVSYAGMAVASIWDEEIRADMNAIGWNPFNSDEMATLNSQKVSFYKGVPVFRTEARRSGTFLGIFLSKRERTANIVKHEWGHTFQQLLLGPAGYGINIGIPSINQMGSWSKNGSYYDAPWETMADMFGGANWGTPHTNNERVLAVAHLLVAFFYGPISFLFTLF